MTQSNRLFRKILVYLFLISLLTCSLTGCQNTAGKTYESISPENETVQLTDEQTEFEEFALDLFRDEITENTLNLHYRVYSPPVYPLNKTIGAHLFSLSVYRTHHANT